MSLKKLKTEVIKTLHKIHDEYAGKAVDFEESGKDEKMQEMFEITDKIEDTIDFINLLK